MKRCHLRQRGWINPSRSCVTAFAVLGALGRRTGWHSLGVVIGLARFAPLDDPEVGRC